MLLKSLEIQGFKTFPDKTKLTFDKGITAVVGPNGSGKSNISDAIRWVLGEQSPKSLRCSKMEDVVFNGTDGRKRQGFAEVTLTIDNTDRLLPFDGDEVAVTRRYYRSGDSDYLINKSAVRLKDIHELFMDTGLGRDGYSMIGQGKIDSIVASKSEDRREIFEEAAGISRYRYRKLEAERKLASAEENLVRLRDIVAELEGRVGPLKVQAEKAEKFLEYSEEKKGLEIALWLETLNKSSAILKEQEDKITVAKAQHDDAERILEEIARETEKLYFENGEISSKIEEQRNMNAEYSALCSSKRGEISVAQNDIIRDRENIERLEKDIAQTEITSEDSQKTAQEKTEILKEVEKTLSNLKAKYDETSEKLNAKTADTWNQSEKIQKLTSEITQINFKLADVRAACLAAQSAAEGYRERIKRAEESGEERQKKYEEIKKSAEEYTAVVEKYKNQGIALENVLKGLEIKLQNQKAKRDQTKAESDKLILDTGEIFRRVKILEDLERNLEGFSQSVKAVMKNSAAGLLGGIHGPVSRVITVPNEYTVAMEIALGGAMQNIVTGTEEDAKKAIELLKQKDAGRATFLPISTIKGKQLNEQGLENCFGYIGVASELCSFKDVYKGILDNLLGRIVVAQDINCAVSIAKKYGYRFKIVTLDGQVVNAGGSLTGGSLAKKSGLLSRATEIERLKRTGAKMQEKSDKLKEEYRQSEENLGKCEQEIEEKRNLLRETQRRYIQAEGEYKACVGEYKNLEAIISENNTQIEETKRHLDESIKTSESSAKLQKEAEDEIAEKEKVLQSLTGKRDDLSREREILSTELQNIRLETVKTEKDIESLKYEIAVMSEAASDQKKRKQMLLNEIEAIKQRSMGSNHRIEAIEKEIALLETRISDGEANIKEFNRQREEKEQLTVELRQKERDKTSEREISGRELARLEERKINLQKQYDDIISKLWEDYELTKREAESVAKPIENIPQAQKRLNELKQKIKSLGSINVGAIEEYKEVSERYEFMTTQVSDVEKSKKEIETLINGLTKQMKEMFEVNFKKISENFTATFKELFGGGTASLSLSEPDNVLTSGIDIIVHPPGKIVVHLEALSGGEKALVAIALYFAIMKVRPAPFCVMDEIEAALDDVNVERFAKYMNRITDKTQFILITHRRGTMEEADVLYGVTMQDEGISKLLELRTAEAAQKLGIDTSRA